MAVSKLNPSSAANDFNIQLTGSYVKVDLSKEYAAGAYSFISGNNDTSLDVYAFNADGSLAGSTSTKSLVTTKGFSKIVVVGGANGDILSFSYKQTFTTTAASAENGVPPIAISVSPSALSNVDDTTTVSGYNFGAGMTAAFIGTDSVARSAKNVVVGSSTSAIITRPDVFPVSASPYDLTLSLAGVNPPTGSTVSGLENAITAGSGPSWVTTTPLATFTVNSAYSVTLQATDPDPAGSIASYTIVSGSLPTGLTITSTSGVISGTPTSTSAASFTVRATNQDGDYADRAFTMPNAGPTWVTAAGAITEGLQGALYSATVVATDDSGVAPTYALTSGSLPTGLTLSSTGSITGTLSTSATTTSFIITASDANGTGTSRSFSIPVAVANVWQDLGTISGLPQFSEGYHGYDGTRYVYFGGGQLLNSGGWPTTFYRFDTQTNAVTSLAAGPQRDEVGSVFLNGHLYVLGGAVNNSNQQTSVWRYKVSDNTWSNRANFSEPFYNSHVGTNGTDIYFVPASSTYNKYMVRFNVAAETFTILAQTSASSDNLGSLTPKMAFDSTLNAFYTMGYSASNAQQRLYRYNVTANSWTILGSTVPRAYGTQIWTGADNYNYGFEYLPDRQAIYIFHWDAANSDTSGVTRSAGTPEPIIRYSTANNTWSLVTASTNANVGTAGATWSSNNALYTLAGWANLGSGQVHQQKLFKVLPS